MRFGGRGKGKSGGYRTLHYFAAVDVPIFLLMVYSKGEQADISQGGRNALKKVVEGIADCYRKSIKEKLKHLPKVRLKWLT